MIDKDKMITATNMLDELRGMIAAHNMMFFEIGRILWEFRKNETYLLLGDGGYDTWGTFLANGDIGIKQSTAYAYISLYEFYIMKHDFKVEEVADMTWDKLKMILPHVRNKNKREIREVFDKARVLSRSDLAIETGLADKEGKFYERFVRIVMCKECHNWKLPKDVKECHCGNTKN